MTDPQANLDNLTHRIDALLPQTQCGQCGHPGCLPYARAVAEGAPHNACPPGGDDTVTVLSSLLARPVLPLDRTRGEHHPTRRVALVREDECIGCTKCIQACPVDAIVGAAKLMHTVIADECTGCELCLPPCPVDCIDILPLPGTDASVQTPAGRERADHARRRYQQRNTRLAAQQARRSRRGPQPAATTSPAPAPTGTVPAGTAPADNLKALQTRYKTQQRLYREACNALERLTRQGHRPAEAATARIDALSQEVDALREQIAVLMNGAKQQIEAETGSRLATLKQQAAEATLALTQGRRAMEAARNAGNDGEVKRQQKELVRLATQAAAAERALSQALARAGLGDA